MHLPGWLMAAVDKLLWQAVEHDCKSKNGSQKNWTIQVGNAQGNVLVVVRYQWTTVNLPIISNDGDAAVANYRIENASNKKY